MTVERPRGPAIEFVDDDATRARGRAVARRRLLASLGLVALCSGVVSSVTVAGQHGLTGAETDWVRTPPEDGTEDGADAAPASDVTGAEHDRGGDTGADEAAWSTDSTIATTSTQPAPPPIVARPIPEATPNEPPPAGPPPPWAGSTTRTDAGYLATDAGCAAGTSAPALDAFFRERMGPVVGLDYQHVYPLGGGRSLWIFQDTFLDHTGRAVSLDQSAFVHNTAMLQDGACFTLLHRGTAEMPQSFEPGTGEQRLRTWFWPMGGEVADGRLQVFWAEMAKRPDPRPPDGLGWDPVRTWVATYDAVTLARADFRPAPDDGVTPIFGYAVSSDETHSYLFGNTFDQRLSDQGGFFGGPHSARLMFLARVPRGQLTAAPEYWDGRGWTAAADRAVAISDRFAPENPMQPRYLGGQWVAVTKVGGYWGEELAIDVALAPQGPWLTVSRRYLAPRGGDPLMNTYHAHLMPWLADGMLVISVSQNARNMLRDAWPNPARYRLQFLSGPLVRPDDAPPQAPTPLWPPTTPPPATPAPTRPTTTSRPTTSTATTSSTSTSTSSSTSSTSPTTSTSPTSSTTAPTTPEPTPAPDTTLPWCSSTSTTSTSSTTSTVPDPSSSSSSTSTTIATCRP